MTHQHIDWNEYTARIAALQGSTATNWELIKPIAKGRVLDVGCGTAIHLARLMELDIQEAIGIDVGMAGLRYGKNRFPLAKLAAASTYHLPFQDDQFDLIFSVDVIEHIEKPLSALREYHRVCKTGGCVFLQTPNYPIKRVYDFWHRLRGSRESFSDDPTHVSPFNTFALINMINKVGFNVVCKTARNILFQEYLGILKRLRSTWIGHCLGQKAIVIAVKTGHGKG
jgi:SAM-dependent methyltransferase